MSRSIVSDILDQYENKQLFPFFIIDFTDGSTDYKYTSLDVTQTLTASAGPSGTYAPRGFQFESISYTMGTIVDDAVVRVDNLDQSLTPAFVGGTVQGQEATLYTGVLNASGGVIGTLMLFQGEIDSFQLEEDYVQITVTSIFTNWSHKSTGKHSSSCRWKVFKGTECAYAGAEGWCDRSYTRCDALANTINFGGFRFLPDLENKTIWWGPTTEQRNS